MYEQVCNNLNKLTLILILYYLNEEVSTCVSEWGVQLVDSQVIDCTKCLALILHQTPSHTIIQVVPEPQKQYSASQLQAHKELLIYIQFINLLNTPLYSNKNNESNICLLVK